VTRSLEKQDKTSGTQSIKFALHTDLGQPLWCCALPLCHWQLR